MIVITEKAQWKVSDMMESETFRQKPSRSGVGGVVVRNSKATQKITGAWMSHVYGPQWARSCNGPPLPHRCSERRHECNLISLIHYCCLCLLSLRFRCSSLQSHSGVDSWSGRFHSEQISFKVRLNRWTALSLDSQCLVTSSRVVATILDFRNTEVIIITR